MINLEDNQRMNLVGRRRECKSRKLEANKMQEDVGQKVNGRRETNRR